MSNLLLDSKEMGATFSNCRTYRYKLWRTWDKRKGFVLFLMLNPSTADETVNDSTVERCERYSRAWGYGGLVVCNIFAYRATYPKDLKLYDKPIGPENDKYIARAAKEAKKVVCGWGNHGSFLERSYDVQELLKKNKIKPYCLKITKMGEPSHPLYLRKDLKPIIFK